MIRTSGRRSIGLPCAASTVPPVRRSKAGIAELAQGSSISAGVGKEVEVEEQPEVANIAWNPTIVVVHRAAVSQALAFPPASSPHGARTP